MVLIAKTVPHATKPIVGRSVEETVRGADPLRSDHVFSIEDDCADARVIAVVNEHFFIYRHDADIDRGARQQHFVGLETRVRRIRIKNHDIAGVETRRPVELAIAKARGKDLVMAARIAFVRDAIATATFCRSNEPEAGSPLADIVGIERKSEGEGIPHHDW